MTVTKTLATAGALFITALLISTNTLSAAGSGPLKLGYRVIAADSTDDQLNLRVKLRIKNTGHQPVLNVTASNSDNGNFRVDSHSLSIGDIRAGQTVYSDTELLISTETQQTQSRVPQSTGWILQYVDHQGNLIVEEVFDDHP